MMIALPNLAGDPGCDVHTVSELRLAQIQVHHGEPICEVPSRVFGKLGPIVFRRASCYWIACGPVPVAVAEDIYAAPEGRAGVRVNGDGMAPAPEAAQLEWRLPDGTLVVPTHEEAGFRILLARYPEIEDLRGPLVFADDPQALGAAAYVPRYHVYSQEALDLFARALRRHGLHEVARPPWWERCVERV